MHDLIKHTTSSVATAIAPGRITLSAAEFQGLAEMPPELEWFASIESLHTRRAYKADIGDFMDFAGITESVGFRVVNRAHVLAWRKAIEVRNLAPATVRRKLAALASLYEYLCDKNAVRENPVKGVRRPKVETYEGKTPALGDHEARALLDAPPDDTTKGLRDRAILSVLLFHALRREELSKLKVKDYKESRLGVPHIRVQGKGGKTRYVPTHPATLGHVESYLAKAGHAGDLDGPLFRPVGRGRPSKTGGLSTSGIYEHAVKAYMKKNGLNQELHAPHALRATAATNALLHGADIAKVQEWLGHSNIQTTRIYDRRTTKPEDSPTFRVLY